MRRLFEIRDSAMAVRTFEAKVLWELPSCA